MTVEVYFKSKIIFKINKLCCKCFTGWLKFAKGNNTMITFNQIDSQIR